MKSFNKFMLVLLVVAFPLASWYYLNTGLNYRKKALIELSPKGNLSGVSPGLDSLLRSQTTVLFEDEKLSQDMQKIFDQFDDIQTFSMIQLGANNGNNDSYLWQYYNDDGIVLDSIFKSNRKAILLDTSMTIRYAYTENSYDFGKLVEHLAIVLPRDVEPDIKVRQ